MSELLQVVQVAEVALVGDALPDDVGAVALPEVGAVNAEEDVAGVNEVLHEGDAQLVGAHYGEVQMSVSLSRQHLPFRLVEAIGRCPPFGDGGHHGSAVAVVMPLRVVVFGSLDDDALVVGQRLVPVVLRRGDAEEAQVVVAGGKSLSAPQDELLAFRGRIVGVQLVPKKESATSEQK